MKEKQQDVYGEPTIIQKGNITARFYQPILTEEEHARRMERIKQATVALLLAQERANCEKEK